MTVEPFTALDRCDHSQSEKATIRLVKRDHYGRHFEIQLCASHYEKGRLVLINSGWIIDLDDRDWKREEQPRHPDAVAAP